MRFSAKLSSLTEPKIDDLNLTANFRLPERIIKARRGEDRDRITRFNRRIFILFPDLYFRLHVGILDCKLIHFIISKVAFIVFVWARRGFVSEKGSDKILPLFPMHADQNRRPITTRIQFRTHYRFLLLASIIVTT